MNLKKSDKGQMMPATIKRISPEAFGKIEGTEIRWLGNASIMINSRGTIALIDPLIEGFDMPLLIEMPISTDEIPEVDAVLITHIDNDHFSRETNRKINDRVKVLHSPKYVSEEAVKEGFTPAEGHDIGDTFIVGDMEITLTPAKHNWQNDMEKYNYREWKEEEYCGFWIQTPDGTIWLPGDSKLLEEHLNMPSPDVILLDFADNSWHITLDGAVKLANTYPNADLILIHWGSVDAPNMNTFNGNPEELASKVINPERVYALSPGEALELVKKD